MKGRISSNSQSIKKHFPEVYKQLFSKCPIVTSSPGSFWWTGEHVVLYGNLGINQKIPLRVYVGLEPSKSAKIKTGLLKEYLPEKKNFFDFLIEEPFYTKLTVFLQEYLLKEKKGLTINVLSEVPISRGLNFSGAFTCAVISALKLYSNELTLEEISNWENMKVEDLIQYYNFDNFFRTSWKIESILHGDSASGGTILGSAVAGEFPLVYFPPKFPQTDEFKTTYWQQRYSYLDTLSYWGARFNELFTLPQYPIWPVDFGLIFSGESRRTASVITSTSERKDELIKIEKEINKLASKLNQTAKKSIIPQSYTKTDLFINIFIEQIKTVSDEILIALKNVFEHGSSKTNLTKFFLALKRNHELISYFVPTSKSIDLIYGEIVKFDTGVKVTGGGGKGDMVFVSDYGGLRDQIFPILKRIQNLTNTTINLDYASWLDGIEDEGVKVEQDLSNKVYSDFISEGAVQVKTIPSEEYIIQELYTREKFANQKESMDLFLDCPEEEIYIKGLKISSRDIPSSKTTIKVLEILFENVGKEVKNTAFENSSYFEDRNEFQSKIVSPLNKTLQKRLGKKLNITVTGGITDFTVKLSPSPFDIYLLERTF